MCCMLNIEISFGISLAGWGCNVCAITVRDSFLSLGLQVLVPPGYGEDVRTWSSVVPTPILNESAKEPPKVRSTAFRQSLPLNSLISSSFVMDTNTEWILN